MYTSRAFVVLSIGQNKKARQDNELSSFALNPHRESRDQLSGCATPRHIGDRLSEVVSTRPASFLEDDYAARSVLRNRAVAFSCGRRCRGLRDLSPCQGSGNCQDHAE